MLNTGVPQIYVLCVFGLVENIYTFTHESVLTGYLMVWYGNSTQQDSKSFHRVLRPAEHMTIGADSPTSKTITPGDVSPEPRKSSESSSVILTMPYSLLQSEIHYHCLKSNTENLRKSFCPHCIHILNKDCA